MCGALFGIRCRPCLQRVLECSLVSDLLLVPVGQLLSNLARFLAVSDTCSRGDADDRSGPNLCSLICSAVELVLNP